MCSIGGFVSELPLDRDKAFRLCQGLLYYGTERGAQSAGIYVNGAVTKKAFHPYAFIETSEFHNAFETAPVVALTHTRQPTCGKREDPQAQPFMAGESVAVHNGYFFDVKGLREQFGLPKPSGVDSELVARFIDKNGITALPRFIEATDGPSAIAAVFNGKLYLARANNPVSFVRFDTEDGNSLLVFASTASILMSAIKYAWLIPPSISPQKLPEFSLFEASHEGLHAVGGRFEDPMFGGFSARDNYGSMKRRWETWEGSENVFDYVTPAPYQGRRRAKNRKG